MKHVSCGLAVLTAFLVQSACAQDSAKAKTATVTTNADGTVTIKGLTLPEQPRFPLPYQTRGTRTDMGPKIATPEPKKTECAYKPTAEELKAHADNADNLKGEFGPLFLGRQVQLNREWDQKQKDAEAACKSGQKAPPLAIMPASTNKAR
jgi:hypothetical protein